MLKLGTKTFDNSEVHRKSEHAELKIREKSGNAENFVQSSKYADVMILVFRKRGMYCFKSQKTCALSNFKDRKLVKFNLARKVSS